MGAKTMPKKLAKKLAMEELDDSKDINSAKSDRKRGNLKSTFSASNLVGGREILSQIKEFCAELKKIARKSSKNGAIISEKVPSDGVLGELKERVRAKERMPLLVDVVKETEV